MITVYRIVKTKRAEDLSGEGAKIYGGRWNAPGTPVLYTAQSRALAALEALVHIPYNVLSSQFSLIEIQIPAKAEVLEIHLNSLPKDWTKNEHMEFLHGIGEKWIKKTKFPVMKVPSAIIPEEYNLIVNPLHPALKKMKIKKHRPFKFDERLI